MSKKEEKYFWHGKGNILIAGVKYKTGDEIPGDKLAEKSLKTHMDAGNISTAEVDVKPKSSETVDQARYRELKKAYDKLVNEKENGGGKCKACPKKDEEIKDLKETGEAAVKRIEELEADVKEKAALIEKLEAELEAATAPPATGDGK